MTKSDEAELDIYMLLESVYNRGYNEGDGFSQEGLLSDFLYSKKMKLESYTKQQVDQAVLAELKMVDPIASHKLAATVESRIEKLTLKSGEK